MTLFLPPLCARRNTGISACVPRDAWGDRSVDAIGRAARHPAAAAAAGPRPGSCRRRGHDRCPARHGDFRGGGRRGVGVETAVGDHMLGVAHDNDIELEGRAAASLRARRPSSSTTINSTSPTRRKRTCSTWPGPPDLAPGMPGVRKPELDGMRMVIPEELPT